MAVYLIGASYTDTDVVLPPAALTPVDRYEAGADQQSMNHSASASAAEKPNRHSGYLYRWRDADGTIHITSDAPQTPVDVETIRYGEAGGDHGPMIRAQTLLEDQSSLADQPLRVYTAEGLNQLVMEFQRIDRAFGRRDRLLDRLIEGL